MKERALLPDAFPLEAIEAARGRIAGSAIRTPVVRLGVEAPAEIWLKLENLQPIGSFKLRGAGNAIARADPRALRSGVVTASAGNMAQGVAWNARRLGIPCHVVVPDHTPQTKLRAIHGLGGETISVPFERWWQVLAERSYPGLEGHFIHPVADPDVIAGNGTIGLEILEDLPDVETVLVPYGGGGLSAGVAAALRAKRTEACVYACEPETAAPLSASLARGEPVEVEYTPSFVDGSGGKAILPEMWALVSELLEGSLAVSLADTAEAIRLLVRHNRVVAEGAGALSVAAALSGRAGTGKMCCVVSGGNIDAAKLATILRGELP